MEIICGVSFLNANRCMFGAKNLFFALNFKKTALNKIKSSFCDEHLTINK